MTSATSDAAAATGARHGKHRRAATSKGVSALMYAAQQGDVERVRKIIKEQSAALLTRDRTGKSPLHYCCTSDSICAAQAADLLVMAAPDLVESRDEDGFTPLHLAVIAGNMPLVTFLLANKADVNAVDNEKHTVVHWATVCGETAALRAVLAAGAPVSTPDVHGGYPLHYAAQMCGGEKESNLGLQVLQTLLTQSDIVVSVEDGDGRQPLLWAASAGSAKAVLALVRAGAGVEAPDKDGLTALHCAASRGHTDCIDTLLTLCGASPDVIDSNGCTALHYAVTLGHADATALLLAHGADPNRQDRKGRSPAHCGCAKGQIETVKMIGAHGANLWLRNARGDLPLHEAAGSGRRDLVRWLLDMRPSQVNARNNDGRCPLHLAALNDNADMCKILLDAGAQVNPILRTSKNTFMTPLDCALQRGFRSTAKYLQLHGGVPASRLGDARQSQTMPANHLPTKDDKTFWGDTSSDSERENGDATKRGKKVQRKKLSHKYEKKRASLSGSDAENSKFRAAGRSGKEKFSEKSQKVRSGRSDSASTDFSKPAEKKVSSSRIDYTNEIVINGKTEINIHNDKQINFLEEEARTKLPSKLSTEIAEKVLNEVSVDKEKRPKSAKSVKGRDKSAKSSEREDSAKRKVKTHRPNSKHKQGTTEQSKQEEIVDDGLVKTADENAKRDSSSLNQSERVAFSDETATLKKKSPDQQSLMSNTSEDVEEHKRVVVEAAVHEPPKSLEEKEIQTIESMMEKVDKMSETDDLVEVTTEETFLEDAVGQISREHKDLDKNILDDDEGNNGKGGDELSKTTEKKERKKALTIEDKTIINAGTEQPVELTTEMKPTETTAAEKSAEAIPQASADKVELPEEGGDKTDDSNKNEPETQQEDSESILKDEQQDTVLKNKEASHGDTTAAEDDEKLNVTENGRSSEESTQEAVQKTGENDTTPNEQNLQTEEGKINEQEISKDVALKEENKLQETSEAKFREELVTEEDGVRISQNSAGDQSGIGAVSDNLDKGTKLEIDKEAEIKDGIVKSEESEKDKNEREKVDEEPVVENEVDQSKKTNEREKSRKKKSKKKQTKLESKKLDEVGLGQNETEHDARDNLLDKDAVETKDAKKQEEVQDEKSRKEKSNRKIHRKKRQTEDQAYEIIYQTLGAEDDDETDSVRQEEIKESKPKEKLKSQKTVSESKSSEDEYSSDIESESSSTSLTVKEHKSFRILDEKEAEEMKTKKPEKLRRKSKSPIRKQRSRSEENKKNKENDKIRRSKIPTPLSRTHLSKSDKYLNIPDRKTKSGMDSRVPSLPNIHESKDRFRDLKEPPRSESNMSAPLLASIYSDNEPMSASDVEDDGEKRSSARKKKVKRRSKTREAKSAGSDYESSNVIDSGFEPSPRSTRIPKWKNMSERGVNMTSVTQSIQSNIRRYHLERKIFQHLLDLKRMQIRAGQHNEAILVKRAIDSYHQSCASTVGAGRYVPEDYSFKSFEKFLYLSLRKLQRNGADYLKGLPESPANPLLCTQSTHRCMHATHAYTGIPCAAYLPKMDHHTIPKIGFSSTQCKPGTGFLPTINQKKAVTLELCHGTDKQVISLPADRLDQNKRYYVTFTVKGNENTPPNEETTTPGHRHSKSD